jgi:multidrug efflux pump subunit AcrA (membrane-fusion protein)
MKELRRALAQVDREIANYRRAVARGDFRSLDTALAAAEQRQATLQAELAHLDGNPQQAVVQLTPATLDQHLQGLTEKLRSGVSGKVREVIERAVSGILVGVDGSLTIEAKSGGLLGLNGIFVQVEAPDHPMPSAIARLSSAGRQWYLMGAGKEPVTGERP